MNDRKDRPEHEETSGFKVADRRKFTVDGELRQDHATGESTEPARHAGEAVPEEESSDRQQTWSQSKQSAAKAPGQFPEGGEEETEGVGFSSFLVSLATSAMVHLGEMVDPATGKPMEDLNAGKQMIDIISMLKEKTQGNLDPDESRLLEGLLYELRMKYLSKAKVINL